MSYFMMGAAAVSIGTGILQGQSAKNSAIKQGNQASAAEGQAIVKERLNKTIANSYSTAFSQMQLALKKKQLATQGNQISAGALAARGEVDAANAVVGGIGASTQAVVSDIQAKADEARQATLDEWENSLINYNNDLDMMVLNNDQSSPNVRGYQYNGPSTGEIIGGSVLSGLAQFGMSYAGAKMKLGLGPKAG